MARPMTDEEMRNARERRDDAVMLLVTLDDKSLVALRLMTDALDALSGFIFGATQAFGGLLSVADEFKRMRDASIP